MPIDYDTLRVIWWALLAVLLIAFAVMDGFDLGVAALLPMIGRTDDDRRVMINSVGPVWEGNQVWFVLGGGAMFAAFPTLYATAFSGFYLAMFLVLVALILRPVGFTFRSKMPSAKWRNFWDGALCFGGVVPTFVFGVALGNVVSGVPFHFNERMLPIYDGGFWGLLTPFPILCGLTAVSMIIMHGAGYLAVKTTWELAARARKVASIMSRTTLVLFLLGGVWMALGVEGYVITSDIPVGGPSSPLMKQVSTGEGVWLTSLWARPWAWLAPLLALAGLVLARAAHWKGHSRVGFVAGGAGIVGIVATPVTTVFPFMLPSSTHPSHSLTVWDATSSHFTLFLMLLAAVVFLPLIVAYTRWVYKVLRGPVDSQSVADTDNAY